MPRDGQTLSKLEIPDADLSKRSNTLEEDSGRVGRPSSRPESPLPPWRHRGDEPRERQSTPEREAPSKFPRVFSLFRFGKTYKIGEREDHPLFAISLHKGWFDRPNLELHDGPEKKDAVIASVRHESDGFSVTSRTLSNNKEGADPNEVTMVQTVASRPDSRAYRFKHKVSKRWARSRETFEWRHGEGEAWDTWKLMRMGAGLSSAARSIGGSREREKFTDDGSDYDEEQEEEIVAVWTIHRAGSETTGKFEFVNSATLGRFGESFATLAIVTALGIWDDGRRDDGKREGRVE